MVPERYQNFACYKYKQNPHHALEKANHADEFLNVIDFIWHWRWWSWRDYVVELALQVLKKEKLKENTFKHELFNIFMWYF